MHNLWRQKSVTLLHHAPSWQALQDARKIEDIILMWTVNFGLNLNETTEEGPRSISVLSLIRDETRLQLVRFLATGTHVLGQSNTSNTTVAEATRIVIISWVLEQVTAESCPANMAQQTGGT